MDKLHFETQWYTRRGGVIRGPFSADEITRHLILGRIRTDDELSQDRLSWATASQCRELLPDELQNLSSWDDYQQMLIVRMKVSERNGDRRRRQGNTPSESHGERRALADRRGKGNDHPLSQDLFGRTHSSMIKAASMKNVRPLLVTMLLVTIVLVWLVP